LRISRNAAANVRDEHGATDDLRHTPRGRTRTASVGSWSGSPASHAYEWRRCDTSGGSCAAIAGATTASYSARTADVGGTLRAAVTASNSAGPATAVSAQSAVVRSFSVTVGAGLADAKLSFLKCSSLALGLSNRAPASGPSVVVLDANLAAGTYIYASQRTLLLQP
jgi:hypothetical protein